MYSKIKYRELYDNNMSLISLLKNIFLEEISQENVLSSPKNLTEHYRVELRHVDFDEVCVWWDYSILKGNIERYKYHSDRHISTELVEVLSKCVEVSEYYVEHNDWVVVPVPMHWSRYFLRWFDHVGLLAQKFSTKNGFVFMKLLVSKLSKLSKRQSKLSRWERLENKKDSISLKNHYTLPLHIILVDDVVSSGATLQECAQVLRNAGVERIICFCVASNSDEIIPRS